MPFAGASIETPEEPKVAEICFFGKKKHLPERDTIVAWLHDQVRNKRRKKGLGSRARALISSLRGNNSGSSGFISRSGKQVRALGGVRGRAWVTAPGGVRGQERVVVPSVPGDERGSVLGRTSVRRGSVGVSAVVRFRREPVSMKSGVDVSGSSVSESEPDSNNRLVPPLGRDWGRERETGCEVGWAGCGR